MADDPFAKKTVQKAPRQHHWRRELVELAALFTAVTVADTVAKTVVNAPDGPVTLVVCAVALAATAGWHTWWARRHTPASAAPAAPDPGVADSTEPAPDVQGPVGEPVVPGGTALWRMRTTVREEPGSLAQLCAALAAGRIDILALQTHPLGESTVDEFLLRAPAALDPRALARLAAGAGGSDTWTERADAHDLVDAPARVLGLATRTALDPAELPLALRQLLGRCTIRSVPGQAPPEGILEGTVVRLPDPSGGEIVVERHHLPFTPTEFARARALVELDTRLGHRTPPGRDALTLPEGQSITIRRADARDLEAALAMHGRCSKQTLTQRYHGPVKDADRYLRHLLSPRFGRTLAVETASGKLVALGHLLWDGDETEAALLVEDAWQRRGIGGELLRRLTGLAREARCESVYAITQASNTGMVAAMRGLGMPLDYQVEEGTLVVTASLVSAEVGAGATAGRGGADAARS
ncbi:MULTISPECIES: GNAT family N-acetyltransferase [unclassified Streptomyces]|uniref:GNAT family N-acetyltransferase n=1 Tax=unclassified Streptomyces TaxID=2593676 RepID=UPI002DD98F58|nr:MULTISPECIES: GNAT family N-acetyltransferase [unclassified Streptomyces]WSA96750.1 GNAT family N-acetyltransferase [Streptomyces sp. NBC_01795]WSS10625.1 GNAT family N-acetyltransferase [Streptomyces sp. NBC_01186]WSS39319.1 GNAT family N-acetyltransferase [Streptomyces sp. NBC_01187]